MTDLVEIRTMAAPSSAAPSESDSPGGRDDADRDDTVKATRHGVHNRLPALALAMAFGVFVIAFAFARSRASAPGAMALFVVGQLIVVAAPLIFVLRRRALSRSDGFGLSVFVGLASFITTQCYSPIVFRFGDSFQHLWTAKSILATQHLFGANPALPVSAQYPGLEIVTTMVSNLTRLSLYASGVAVVGVAHVLVMVLVFTLVVRLGLSPRVAAITVLVFSAGFFVEFFLSFFLYYSLALPLLLACMIASVEIIRSRSSSGRTAWSAAAIAFGAATIVTHHVSSYVLLGALGILCVVLAIRREYLPALRQLLVVTAVLAILTAIWDLGVASYTIHYLSRVPNDLLGVGSKKGAPASSQPSSYVRGYVTSEPPSGIVSLPTIWRVLGDGAVALIATLIPIGAWVVLKGTYRLRGVLLAIAAMCLGYYLLAPVFLFSPGSNQLVGRMQAYVLVPVGIMVALAIDYLLRHSWSLRARTGWGNRIAALAGLAALPCLLIGGLLAPWPDYSAKLPGPYQVAAGPRSTDARVINASSWMAQYVGVGKTVAATFQESAIFSANGGQHAQRNVATLFESESLRARDVGTIRALRVQYVIADYRMTTQLPAEGSYFDRDPLAGLYGRPLPRAVLSKFDAAPGVTRSFDDGKIVVYDVRKGVSGG